MNIIVEFDEVLKACEDQSALDFKGIRARDAAAADAVYDDWVFNEENILDVDSMMEEYAADMKHALRSIVGKYTVKDYGVKMLEIEMLPMRDDSDLQNLPKLVRLYFVSKILTWWYVYRDSDIAALYEKKTTSALERILSECTPVVDSGHPRYF